LYYQLVIVVSSSKVALLFSRKKASGVIKPSLLVCNKYFAKDAEKYMTGELILKTVTLACYILYVGG